MSQVLGVALIIVGGALMVVATGLIAYWYAWRVGGASHDR